MTLAVERDLFREYQNATGAERAELEEEIIKEHWNLTYLVINRLYTSQVEHEDLHSVALIGLLQAVRTYNPDAGFTFSTYAARCIGNELNKLLNSLTRQKRQGAMRQVSLDAPIKEQEGRMIAEIVPNDEMLVDDAFADSDLYRKALTIIQTDSRLTERERQVIMWRVEGVIYSEIARRLNLSPSRVSQIGRNGVAKIQQRLEALGLQTDSRTIKKSKHYDGRLLAKLKKNGIGYSTFTNRVAMGWSAEKASTEPVTTKRWNPETDIGIRNLLQSGMKPQDVVDVVIKSEDRTRTSIEKRVYRISRKMKQEGLI